MTMDENAKDATGEGHRKGDRPDHDPRLRIVKEKEKKKPGDDLDLDLGEFEGDRRYGREDIADK
jgi:hypothetical protein